MLLKSLKQKILLTNMLFTMAVLFGAFFVIFAHSYMRIRYENRQILFELPEIYHAGMIAPIAAQASTPHYITNSAINRAANRIFFVISVDENGAPIRSGADLPPLEETYQVLVREALKNRSMDKILSLGDYTRYQAHIVISADNSSEKEIYFLDVSHQRNSLKNLLLCYLWIAPLTLIPIFFLSLHIADRTTKPILEAWEQQRRFVADASHELKTPLAVISANTDALSLSSPGENSEWIGYIKDEIVRMSQLVSSLLTLAKADEDLPHNIRTRFDISRTVLDAVTLYEAMAYEKQVDLRYEVENAIFINSDESSVRRIVSALLDNAVKYTPQNGFISIRMHKHKSITQLEIENSGSGIQPEDLPHLFERFYRVDKARENEDGSFGLGLAIVKSLVQQLGGNISVKSVEGESIIFTVAFKNS